MRNIGLLLPEMLVAASAIALLLADAWVPAGRRRGLCGLGMLAVLAGLAAVAFPGARAAGTGGLWVLDPLAVFFKVLVLAGALLTLVFTLEYEPEEGAGPAGAFPPHAGSYAAMLLFACAGLMLLVMSTDLLLIFLSLELVSISSFVLAGYEHRSPKASEGAIKYFLIGAFSSAIMVYGISFVYGVSGTTSLAAAGRQLSPAYMLGLMLILVGFGFKASVAPFHLWVPDAYQGAPTPVTAFLSVAPKVAALAAMLRVFVELAPAAGWDFGLLLGALSMLTMTVGNLTALFQTNMKRLLAYSSIAQAGYMVIGLAAAGKTGKEGLLVYSLAYLFMNMGAFAVAVLVANAEARAGAGGGTAGGHDAAGAASADPYDVSAYDGLHERSFGTALLMAVFLLSLAGIPPLAGFIGKFYVFAAAIEGKRYWLASVAVLNSVVAAYYYMKIVGRMFLVPAGRRKPLRPGFCLSAGLAFAALGVLLVGLYPGPFIAAIRASLP